ncbi:FAD-dependent oxidoreductase [Candidatus Parcubacteria bacterium]|nr:FAD-dependent oxidoreductase [Candidatus Parcubacteria bacterium]
MHDLIIIGAGPAGYAASIYASRYNLKNLIIGKELGGQISEAHIIENYPGYTNIIGRDLMEKFKEQVEYFGAEIVNGKAVKIIKKDNSFLVIDENGQERAASAIIITAGASYRKLGIVGENEFVGKGVSYCFVCDGPFFKNKRVAVVGGANSAAMAADYLAKICRQVYMIFRKVNMTASPIWQERVKNNPKIKLINRTNVIEMRGEQLLEKIILDNPRQNSKALAVDGAFIEIGSIPNSGLARELNIKTNKEGYIKVDSGQSTSIKGIFAAGDITDGSNGLRQVITAASEGAIAATSAYEYLKK